MLDQIKAQIESFLLIQIFICIAVGFFSSVALWALGVNQPAFWGAAAGVLSSVPYLRPIFVVVALPLVAFVQFDSISIPSKIGVVCIVIFSLEGLLVKTAVVGKAARINGIAMFIGLLFWSWMWGWIGMIVAVPAMMIIKSVCDHVDGLQFIAELLAELERTFRIGPTLSGLSLASRE